MKGKFSNLFTGLEIIIHTALFNVHALNVEEQIGQRRLCLWMFTNLSKVFDTLNHKLLIAKLEACGFKWESLSFIKSYIRFMSITILVLGKRSLHE